MCVYNSVKRTAQQVREVRRFLIDDKIESKGFLDEYGRVSFFNVHYKLKSSVLVLLNIDYDMPRKLRGWRNWMSTCFLR